MNSLRKLVWLAYCVVGGMLALIILLGGRQYILSDRYSSVMEQSERAIFHFATIRESVTDSLIDRQWQRLEMAIPEIQALNSELVRLQESTLVPTEFKLAMVDKVDLAGIIISLRRLISGDDSEGESRKLQEQMRAIADHLLQYDRIIVSQARGRILNFQLVIIGSMGLIISLASFSLNRLYKNTVVPLLRISNQLQATGGLPEDIVCSSETCTEVADLIQEIRRLAEGSGEMGASGGAAEVQQQKVAELVNETTNQLNGIINYAQLLVDDQHRELSEQDRQLLHKIIESGQSIAETWQKSNWEG